MNLQQSVEIFDEESDGDYQLHQPLNSVSIIWNKIKQKYEKFSGKHEDKELTQLLDEYHENFIQSAWKFIYPFITSLLVCGLTILFIKGTAND
jgi:hypothetical protein